MKNLKDVAIEESRKAEQAKNDLMHERTNAKLARVGLGPGKSVIVKGLAVVLLDGMAFKSIGEDLSIVWWEGGNIKTHELDLGSQQLFLRDLGSLLATLGDKLDIDDPEDPFAPEPIAFLPEPMPGITTFEFGGHLAIFSKRMYGREDRLGFCHNGSKYILTGKSWEKVPE